MNMAELVRRALRRPAPWCDDPWHGRGCDCPPPHDRAALSDGAGILAPMALPHPPEAPLPSDDGARAALDERLNQWWSYLTPGQRMTVALRAESTPGAALVEAVHQLDKGGAYGYEGAYPPLRVISD